MTTITTGTNFNNTAANGFVTADGFGGPNSGPATFPNGSTQSVAAALTSTGSSVTDALALTARVNEVTVGASTTGVKLPTVASVGIGGAVVVINANGANAFHIYGSASDTIDGTAAGTGISLTNPKRAVFWALAAATWISAAWTAAAS